MVRVTSLGCQSSILALALCFCVLGCSEKKASDASQLEASKQLREAPDLGAIKKEQVEVSGTGNSRAEAINDALALAVSQVNGATVDGSGVKVNVTASIKSSLGDLDFKSQAFAQAVAMQTGGAITDFKLISEKESGKVWTVKIGANVAKYQASADATKPRIIVAIPRTQNSYFSLGDEKRPASEVAGSIRARVTEALMQSNRFAVLDREYGEEIQSELDAISSGSMAREETARLGQQLSADLIVVPTIERFDYVKNERHLRNTDRTLVSYSGGARLNVRVLNATTGQLVLSESYEAAFPTTSPTTLRSSVDTEGPAKAALESMSRNFVDQLLRQTFPISVVSLSGSDVVLSQGGSNIKLGGKYRAVMLGDEIMDPQTGRSLGRSEVEFGQVTISRLTPNLAYGKLENAPSLGQTPFRPGLIEIREEVAAAASPSPVASGDEKSAAVKKPVAPARLNSGVIDPGVAGESTAEVARDKDW